VEKFQKVGRGVCACRLMQKSPERMSSRDRFFIIIDSDPQYRDISDAGMLIFGEIEK
jgi:hypothetical protein